MFCFEFQYFERIHLQVTWKLLQLIYNLIFFYIIDFSLKVMIVSIAENLFFKMSLFKIISWTFYPLTMAEFQDSKKKRSKNVM